MIERRHTADDTDKKQQCVPFHFLGWGKEDQRRVGGRENACVLMNISIVLEMLKLMVVAEL